MSTSSVESAQSSQSNRPRIYERLTKSALRGALYKKQLIRRFEESAEDAYVRGQSYGTMHLSIGEEATAVGACVRPCRTPTTSPRPIAVTATASPRALR